MDENFWEINTIIRWKIACLKLSWNAAFQNWDKEDKTHLNPFTNNPVIQQF